MKSWLLIGMMGVMGAMGAEEFRVVRGDVVPMNSREWTILGGNLQVTSASGANLFCRTFTEETLVNPIGGWGNARLMPVYHKERSYGEVFLLTNYPNARSYKSGDILRGPVAAMRLGTTKWVGSVHNVYTYSSGSSSTYGDGGICDLYDYGAPFKAAARVLSPGEVKAANAAAARKAEAAAGATFRFYQDRAESGDAAGQLRLGRLYLEGKGTLVDTNRAREWFAKAAKQGNEEAERELKRMAESR